MVNVNHESGSSPPAQMSSLGIQQLISKVVGQNIVYTCTLVSWYATINNSIRCITHSTFKHEIIFENYLDCIAYHKLRVALC